MNLSKKVFALSLLTPLAMQGSFIGDYADALKNKTLYVGGYAAPIILIPATLRLFWKDPKPDAKPRYDLDKLFDVEFAKNDPKAYLENYWLLIDDGFIGQYFKDKHMTWKADGTIKQSRKAMPFGILGWTWSGIKTQEKAVKFLTPVVVGYAALKDNKAFMKFFGMAEEKKDDKAPAITAQDLQAFAAAIAKGIKEGNADLAVKVAEAIAAAAYENNDEAPVNNNNNNKQAATDVKKDNTVEVSNEEDAEKK